MRVVEPFLRAKVATGAVTGGRVPIGWLFCHWVLLQCKRTGVGLGVSACAMPSGASDDLPSRWRVVSSQIRY
ncbi:hypothetical protein NK6_8045 [Bradyrhizobium diazoefficiens]|uniref:Uncharacterized protein n=1 Tax=Bradyrhizobium diazoefficiens TaxID=1355477 RepID=A0A0E3VWN0_9BRAD|nr:hypothetical protein NK6_8045 [Bradyrhizobium diazoefficiens]